MLCFVISKNEYDKAINNKLTERLKYVYIGAINDVSVAENIASQFPCYTEIKCYNNCTPCCYIICN